MKRLATALGLIALCAMVPATLKAGPEQEQISGGCAKYCRETCIINGEPCCFLGPNTCGCC
jgi:hypothetical protein